MKLSKEEISRKNVLVAKAATGNALEKKEASELKALLDKEAQGKLTFPEIFPIYFVPAGKVSPEGWIAPETFAYDMRHGSKSEEEHEKSVKVCSKSYAAVISAYVKALHANGLEIVTKKATPNK